MIRGQVYSNTAWMVRKKGSHGKVDDLHLYCINTRTIMIFNFSTCCYNTLTLKLYAQNYLA